MTDKKRHRSFCFTINNYTEDVYVLVQDLLRSAKYGIVGREVGESGTPHLQGYVQFANPRNFRGVCAALPGGHVEVAHGTPSQNQAYCSKGGGSVEFGTLPSDGGPPEIERWGAVLAHARSGDFESIAALAPDIYIRHLRLLEYVFRRRPQVLETIEGLTHHEWICGPTGCGKSRTARSENPGAYIKDPRTKWWDGYLGEDTVIIDDFDKYQVDQTGDMKRWLDRYPFQAEFKGGMEMIRPRKIIVTSQYLPKEIWREDEKSLAAVERRVELITMGGPPVIPEMFAPGFRPYPTKK